MKSLAYDFALRAGFTLKRKVPDEQVIALLQKLRPVRTRFELVRMGGESDGGYLVPDDLTGIAACFSPGVDVTASFEQDMLDRGIACYLADASVDGPPLDPSSVDFEKKYIGTLDDEITMTMDGWFRAKLSRPYPDVLLQMDIEGHEWPVLLNVSDEVLSSIRIMVLEIHSLPSIFDGMVHMMYTACIDRLNRFFHVVHAHPNNVTPNFRYRSVEIPHFLELTLLRKDRSPALGLVDELPHHLDRPNIASRPDVRLKAPLIG